MSRKREHERALFTAFLDVEPEFAGERLTDWQQPTDESDFPDIIATSVMGRKIGVELGECLNEEEIQAAKHKERLEEAFLSAVGDQGLNPTQYIRYVWPPPQVLRVMTADRSACSARQLVASRVGSKRKLKTASYSVIRCVAKRRASARCR